MVQQTWLSLKHISIVSLWRFIYVWSRLYPYMKGYIILIQMVEANDRIEIYKNSNDKIKMEKFSFTASLSLYIYIN